MEKLRINRTKTAVIKYPFFTVGKDTKQSEKLVEQTLVSEIKKVGGLTFKMLVVNFAGFPDRLCLVRGKAFFIECKTTGKNPTPIQRYVHRKLREQLFNVYVCDTTDEVKKAISENI